MAGSAAWAAWSGAHGLALYLGGLLVLLMACTAASRLAALKRASAATSASRARILGCGGALAVGAAGMFALIAWHLRAGTALAAADTALMQALGPTVSPAVHQAFAVLAHAADTATLTVLCVVGAALLIARRQPVLAVGWVLAIAGNGTLNTMLKQTFGRLRPAHLEGVLTIPGLSFPSGHSSGAVVAYGMAAYLAGRLLAPRWHLPALLLAAALAFSIGASRIVLQVHFPSDVLAGFASGSAWLTVCITGLAVVRQTGRVRQPRPPAPP